MKNFDEDRIHRAERDRTFQIGGETFTYLPSVKPELLVSWNEAVTGEVTLGEAEWLKLYDETILGILEPGQEETWKKVRDSADPAINLSDLTALMEWLLAEQSGRPTGPPSESLVTDGRTSTASTESSSPEPAAVPVS